MNSFSPAKDLSADTEFGFIDSTITSQRAYNPVLFSNQSEFTMLRAILGELRRSKSFQFSVAFISSSGLALLKQELLDFQGQGTIYTSTYLDFNDPGVFEELLKLKNIEVRVLDDSIDAFHSKGYIFQHHTGTSTAIIGSSNLTRGALLRNEEWNLRFSALPDGDVIVQLEQAIERLRNFSTVLTPEWIKSYEVRRRPQVRPTAFEIDTEQIVPVGKITPNTMQAEALEQIKKVQDSGEKRALVISATGTGKTILAALAVRQSRPARVLFVVHRDQILNKAIDEFKKVLDATDEEFGKFVGPRREIDRKYVFATIQTVSKEETLRKISADQFDLIIIDEVHKAGAESYQRLINYFEPHFLLGLTATPERSDSFNIYELFDHNVPYEIRLQKALEEQMLVPFSYYGVTDFVDANGTTIDETTQLARLVMSSRVEHIIENLEKYGHSKGAKGLIFCSRNEEAAELSEQLNQRSVNGSQLRTTALSGAASPEEREFQVKRLENGEVDYLLTVDIFNEGIDIPAVNQIVMLRNTNSSIIFTQQLGRGLRKAKNKSHLRVIDFIGNYKNNFLIPIALFGNKSLDKESVRKSLINARQQGSIAGVSSVSFDEIAQERVLEALEKAKLNSLASLKEAYKELEYRLGRIPTRYDFARFDTARPTAFITSTGQRPTYWDFLKQIKQIESAEEELSPLEHGYLALFDRELMNGKRPQELLLVRELLQKPFLADAEVEDLLVSYGADYSEHILSSIESILTLDFFTSAEKEGFNNEPIIVRTESGYCISPKFKGAYEGSSYFQSHINDSIQTGLYLNEHLYSRTGELLVGERYSRKDVCRLLNWPANHQSTMYGYKPDFVTGTCPIFITYHKSADIDEAINYQDHLEDEQTMFWYTKHTRTLKHKVEKQIAEGVLKLDVFVKKDAAEGTDFVYLGQADPRDAQETKTKSNADIVNMRLGFKHPLERGLYDYLTKATNDRIKGD